MVVLVAEFGSWGSSRGGCGTAMQERVRTANAVSIDWLLLILCQSCLCLLKIMKQCREAKGDSPAPDIHSPFCSLDAVPVQLSVALWPGADEVCPWNPNECHPGMDPQTKSLGNSLPPSLGPAGGASSR